MEKCLIRGGRGHQEREERGCVLPWNITYFASSERGFLKMPQALGAEKAEVAFWSSKDKNGAQTDSVCVQQCSLGKAGGTGGSQEGRPGSKGQEKLTQRWGLPRVAVERRGHLLR